MSPTSAASAVCGVFWPAGKQTLHTGVTVSITPTWPAPYSHWDRQVTGGLPGHTRELLCLNRERRVVRSNRTTEVAGKTCRGAGTHLSNHAPPSLVALTVCSPLLLLLQYAFPTSPILKGKLSQRVTELHDTNVPSCLCGVAQVEQEGMEPRQVGRSGRLE